MNVERVETRNPQQADAGSNGIMLCYLTSETTQLQTLTSKASFLPRVFMTCLNYSDGRDG